MSNTQQPFQTLVRAGLQDLGSMLAMLEVSEKEGFDGIDLSNCDLAFSTFRRLSFKKANFSHSNFEHSQFIECELNGANFEGVDLSKVSFINCKFGNLKILDTQAEAHTEELIAALQRERRERAISEIELEAERMRVATLRHRLQSEIEQVYSRFARGNVARRATANLAVGSAVPVQRNWQQLIRPNRISVLRL